MEFKTDLYFTAGSQSCFGWYQESYWVLWFVEADIPDDRQAIIESHQFHAKPTKRQVRNLRKKFKKYIKGIL